MKFEKTFLRSKVAQRIAFLFILCALIPIATLSILSFDKVNKHLREQSLARLHQTGKTLSMAVYERLLFLEADLKRLASKTPEKGQDNSSISLSIIDEYQKDRFKNFVVFADSEKPVPIFGSIPDVPKFSKEENRLMLEGETLLTTDVRENQIPRIFLSRIINPKSGDRRFIMAEVEPFYLWFMGYETSLPAMTEFFILDHNHDVLFSTLQSSTRLPEQISSQLLGSSSGQFDWTHKGKGHLASYRDIFLQPKFQTSTWTVITSESKAFIHSPVASFKKPLS